MSDISLNKQGYIKSDRSGLGLSRLSLVFVLGLLICILYIYECWYVQTFPNIGIVVKGTTVCLVAVFLLHILFESHSSVYMGMVPNGIWANLILIAYCFIVGPFVAYNTSELINSLIIYIGFIVASMVICYISSQRKSIDWFLNIVLGTAFLCSIYALLRGERYYGFGLRLSYRNNIHIFSVVLFFGIFALAYKTKKTMRSLVIHFIPAVFFVYCIVESTSRKCLIASSILILIWLFVSLRAILKDKTTGVRITIVLITVSLLIVAFLYFYMFFLQSRLFRKFETFTNEESNSLRIDMYKIAGAIFLDKPLFGGGFDQYQFWSGSGSYSHSTYAEAIADLGFFGSVIFFVPIILAGFRLFRLVCRKDRTYQSQITLALLCAELFLGVGQIFFLEPQHIFIFSAIYWIEMNETNKIMQKKQCEGDRKNETACKYLR